MINRCFSMSDNNAIGGNIDFIKAVEMKHKVENIDYTKLKHHMYKSQNVVQKRIRNYFVKIFLEISLQYEN